MLDTRAVPSVDASLLPVLPEVLERCRFEKLPPGCPPSMASIHLAAVAALNYAYAERHVHRFRYVKSEDTPAGWTRAWNKVFYVANRSAAVKESAEPCEWLLIVDSDALVSASTRNSLPKEIEMLASRYDVQHEATFFVAREQAHKTHTPGISWVNPGVMIVRPSQHSLQVTRAWQQIGALAGHSATSAWPAEMGVLTEMMQPGLLESADSRFSNITTAVRTASQPGTPAGRGGELDLKRMQAAVATVNMSELNGPWGAYVKHTFSDHYRARLLGPALARDLGARFGEGSVWNATGQLLFERALRGARQSTETFTPRLQEVAAEGGRL